MDHMCKAHNTPISVKAGNLARWFPPWTVTREQWHRMSRPSVSGIAIDTFLFSRIGMPLFHRYRVFDHLGSHPAFRGPYMSRLFAFLEESDAETIRRSHRRRAKEIAVSMSKRTALSKDAPVDSTLSRWSMNGSAISKITSRETGPSLLPTAGGCAQSSASSIYRRSAEEDTVQALMDLSLPRFTKLDDGVIPKTNPWPVTENSPASPVSAMDGYRKDTTSPCMDLDDISSCSSVSDASPHDFKVTLLYDSANLITPVGSIVFSSEEDVPLSSGQEDRRKVCKPDPRPMKQPRLTDVKGLEPTPRERLADVPEYEPTSREKPGGVPEYVPTPREKPVDVSAYGRTTRDRPVDEATLRGRPVDDPAYELMPMTRPVEIQVLEATPRERPTDDLALRGRPVDDPTLDTTTSGRPADGPKAEPKPKERPVDPKTAPLMYKALTPADLPEWSDHDSDEPSRVRERPVRESVRERPTDTLETLRVHMPTVVAEKLDLAIVGLCLTDKRNMPICREQCISDSQRPKITSSLAFQQIDTENASSLGTNGYFGVCGTVDRDRCPEAWASS